MITMKKYLIVLVFAVSVSVTFSCNSSSSQAQAESVALQEGIIAKNVSAAEFKGLIDDRADAVLLDVRTSNEVAQGVIKNAVHIDFYDGSFMKELDKLDKSKPVLIYCRSGRRSAAAMSKMSELGFTEIYNLQGGIIEWANAGEEVVK
jgi:rhodanese-related sulfurtransferase